MTMKMAIDGIIKPNPRACGVCGKSRQTVPVNIEAFMIERVDRLMKHMPFVDVFAVRQAGSNQQNAEMVTVAVYTARKFTSLRPHLIYDGNDNEFTDWLDRHGVRIIRHRSLFRAQLASWAKREENPYIAAAVSGAFLRVELPRLVTSDLVLYTDCDVIFRDEVVPDLRRLRCDYFTVAPDARESHDDIINSGVMVMNLARLRKTADEFYQVIFDKLDELKQMRGIREHTSLLSRS